MIILCADDYGLTEGVSRAIEELARHRRLSATSAIVTAEEWPRYVGRLAALRGDIATGLHLNLTLGEPLGRMPGLAPTGTLPEVGKLVRTALTGRLDKREIKAELIRQMERFQATLGSPPDHIDGHQHVHVLPIVRDAFLEAMAAMNWALSPLVRNPADTIANILWRRRSAAKAMTVAALSAGFGRRLSRAGFLSNDTFGGFSDFEAGTDYRAELTAAFERAGSRHLVMCHPGFVDDQLAALDPVVERRAEEYRSLMDAAGLPPRIWHPDRPANGPPIDWRTI